MFIDVVLIGILILANGFFAASEMALVTTRRTRLKMIEKSGDQRAAKVLAVQDNPGNFLAMVQIGITLVGTTAAAVGGAEIVRILSPFIASIQLLLKRGDCRIDEVIIGLVSHPFLESDRLLDLFALAIRIRWNHESNPVFFCINYLFRCSPHNLTSSLFQDTFSRNDCRNTSSFILEARSCISA